MDFAPFAKGSLPKTLIEGLREINGSVDDSGPPLSAYGPGWCAGGSGRLSFGLPRAFAGYPTAEEAGTTGTGRGHPKQRSVTASRRCTVSARFTRQDFFTYQPSFKLIVAGNHRPSLRNVDEAIRRRFNLVPFTVTIPPAERDPGLAEKLKEEWPGILAWAIEGCLEWQRIGLVPPSAVTEATENYLTEEDAVGRFISECCERRSQALAELKDLYIAYKKFCETTGEAGMSQKSFSQKLEGQNLAKGNDSRSRRVRFQGIRLRPKDDDPEAWLSPPDAVLRESQDA
jgi:hypothetical protein